MQREVIKMGNPLLLEKSAPILPHEFGSEMLRELINDLNDTRIATKGLGIAAPQIGILKQVVVIEYSYDNPRYADIGSHPLTIIINPTLTPVGNETTSYDEGCLSVPGLRGTVVRPIQIKYEYFDFDGNKITGEDSTFFARVLQHECDHLFGILYPMRITDMRTFGFSEELAAARQKASTL